MSLLVPGAGLTTTGRVRDSRTHDEAFATATLIFALPRALAFGSTIIGLVLPRTCDGSVWASGSIRPVVSLVVCTRNRAGQLADFLEAAAGLHCEDGWELIVVDNGSIDDTAQILAAARSTFRGDLRTLRVEQPGLGRARNVGLAVARGELIAYVDDDCRPAPGFLDEIVRVFRERPEVGVVGGRVLPGQRVDSRVSVTRRHRRKWIRPYSFVPAGLLLGANLTFRRAVLLAIGGFDERFGAGTPYPCEDVEAVARVAWGGCGGLFDPRPTVYHDHGRRRRAVVAATRRGYDTGRGAYYWQFLRDRRSRGAYLRGWMVYTSLYTITHLSLGRFWREFRAALQLRHSDPVRFSATQRLEQGRDTSEQ